MGYLIEKETSAPIGYHLSDCFESWEKVGDKISEFDAIDEATEMSKAQGGTKFRVRSIWDGKVSFQICSQKN